MRQKLSSEKLVALAKARARVELAWELLHDEEMALDALLEGDDEIRAYVAAQEPADQSNVVSLSERIS